MVVFPALLLLMLAVLEEGFSADSTINSESLPLPPSLSLLLRLFLSLPLRPPPSFSLPLSPSPSFSHCRLLFFSTTAPILIFLCLL